VNILLPKKVARRAIVYLLVFIFSAIAIFPILWIISCSLKPPEEIYAYPPSLVPENPTLENFGRLLEIRGGQGNMYIATLNSLKVTVPALLICLTISALGGYYLSRSRSRIKSRALFFIFFVQLVPAIVLIIPLYVWFAGMGLIDNLMALTIAYQSFLVPLSTAFMKDYFDSIPSELEEAAMIDGCSRFSALIKVILPLASPGIVSIAIYAFLHGWGEYLLSSILILTPPNRTVPLQLGGFIMEYTIDWGGIMAASVWALIPVILIYLFLQRYFVAGLTGGAVKA